MSDSSQPHGLQPTRLLRPWYFPGKNTGVSCHCLLWEKYPSGFIGMLWLQHTWGSGIGNTGKPWNKTSSLAEDVGDQRGGQKPHLQAVQGPSARSAFLGLSLPVSPHSQHSLCNEWFFSFSWNEWTNGSPLKELMPRARMFLPRR